MIAILTPLLLAQAAAPAPKPTPAASKVPVAEAPQPEIERLRDALGRSQTALDNARGELATARREAAQRDELLALARTRNAELFAIGNDILERYRRKDFTKVLAGSEVFVQKSRVALENLVQDYEDKLRAARFTEQTLPPSVEAQMRAELERRNAAPAAAPTPPAK